MFTLNSFDGDPEGMRGLVPCGFVHMLASPETRPFRPPVAAAADCPEQVVLGFFRSVMQLKLLADAAPRS